MSDLKSICVLVPGPMHAPTLETLKAKFEIIQGERGTTDGLSEDQLSSIQGIASMTGCDASMMNALAALKIVSNFGVGYDGVDCDAAAQNDVMVTNTPDVLSDEVADTAIGLLINTVRELPAAERWLRNGDWVSKGAYPLTRGTLRGRKMGIFGLGRIGKAIAHRAEAFSLEISYFGRKPQDVPYTYYASLVEMAQAVDTLMVVAPGTPQTENAVNEEVLSALGPDGVLINIGRGSVVNEAALEAALKNGTIFAAGLDVFAKEPHVPEGLLTLPNLVALPHVGSASEFTRIAMGQLLVDNLASWFSEGKAVTPVPETEHVQA
ncbi:MAG: 2-hydroxyacid dehydrogenase [Pseudomonadota bacterium]